MVASLLQVLGRVHAIGRKLSEASILFSGTRHQVLSCINSDFVLIGNHHISKHWSSETPNCGDSSVVDVVLGTKLCMAPVNLSSYMIQMASLAHSTVLS